MDCGVSASIRRSIINHPAGVNDGFALIACWNAVRRDASETVMLCWLSWAFHVHIRVGKVRLYRLAERLRCLACWTLARLKASVAATRIALGRFDVRHTSIPCDMLIGMDLISQ